MKCRHALAMLSAASLALLAAAGLAPTARGTATPPSTECAEQATATLTQALVSAVASISDGVPAGSTPEQIEAASLAVSLLLPDCQDGVRLLDATGSPLDPSNVARDRFELRALAQLADGRPGVQAVVASELRTLVPLTSDMHPNCVTCHAEYAALPPNSFVGAAALRVGL